MLSALPDIAAYINGVIFSRSIDYKLAPQSSNALKGSDVSQAAAK